MQHTFHCHLRKSLSWYHNWHDHPHHQHAHWAFFAIVSILIFSFISGNIRDFYFENEAINTARAQTGVVGDYVPSYQEMCPAGYIAVNGANASTADPSETAGWFCDDNRRIFDFANITGITYPFTGLLICEANSGTAFNADGRFWPCNSGRPTDPGWEFINGVPHQGGNPVNLDDEVSCPGSKTVTITDSDFITGAFTNNPSTRGVLCVPGTIRVAATPTPTPIPPTAPAPLPRYIYYIDLYSVQAGQTITIVGQNLATTVNFNNTSGTSVQATGTSNADNSEVIAVVPSSLSSGLYTVSVGPNPDSNTVEIEIIGGVYNPGPTSGQNPIISALNPVVISQGGVLEIMGQFLTPVVQFINVNGAITTVNGSISPNYGTTTVYIPDSLAPSIYTVAVVSPYGTGTGADVLTVIESNPPIAPAGISPQSLPSATSFQELITNAFNYSLIVVGIAVFIMIMWGGFLWLTSAANPANLGSAKNYITNAILGALLLVSAYVILYTINPELVGGGFNLPGIEVPIIPGKEGTVSPITGCSASQQPAATLLTNLGVGNFSTSADCGGNNHALQNIQAMAGGSCPSVCSSSCDCIAGGPTGNITVDPIILAALNELRVTRGTLFKVTSFTTGEHDPVSYHYAGRAVDIVPNDKNFVVWGEVRGFLAGKGGTAFCEIGGTIIPNCDNFSGGAHIHWQR